MLPALAIILVFSIAGGLTDAHLLKVVSETHVKNTPNTLLPGDLRSNEMKSIQTESLQAETSHDGIKSVGVGGVRYSESQHSTSSAMFAHDRNQGPTRGKRNNSRLNESGVHASRHKRQSSDVACRGTLVGSGTIRSPNFPGNYQNNLNCHWTLQASSPATLLLLQIRRFSTEASYDILRISNTSGLQISLSGELQPRNVTITSPATISFTTDGSVLRTGFEIAFSTMTSGFHSHCGSLFRGSGFVRSPGYPGAYQNNIRCDFNLLAATDHNTILLQLRSFATEMCCDHLIISDNLGLRLSYSGVRQPVNITLGSHANISFSTDGSQTGSGFEFFFSSHKVDVDSCGIGWTKKSGMCYKITSPMSWNNTRQACNSVDSFPADIASPSQENDIYDFLNSRGVNRAWIGLNDHQNEGQYQWDSGRPLTYLNWANGEPNDNSENEDCVEIFAEGRSGWNDNVCSASFHGVCQKLDRLKSTGVAVAHVKKTQHNARSYMSFYIRNHYARGRKINISRLIESGSEASRHKLQASGVGSQCGSFFRGSGFVRSPGFPGTYQNNIKCDFNLEALPYHNAISLQLRSFATEEGYDRLTISDNFVQLFSLSGVRQPVNITLGSRVKMSFITDSSITGAGFDFFFSSININVDSCGNGWTTKGGDCYKITSPMAWNNARQACSAVNGFLTDISSRSQESDIYDFLNSTGVKRAWIGLNDHQNEGRYQWNSGRAVTYLNWARGEPNDKSSNEDCVEIFAEHRSGWNDNICNASFHGVCRKVAAIKESCGGRVYAPHEISSAGGANCQWTVEASQTSNSLLLTFGSIFLDECCNRLTISDGSEFEYVLSEDMLPRELHLRSPIEITLVSNMSYDRKDPGWFTLNVTEVPGKAPRICSGIWVMHNEMCVVAVGFVAPQSWFEARSWCRYLGGILTELDDDDKVLSAAEFLAFYGYEIEEVWIGLKRGQAQNQWQWDSGRPMNYSSWAAGQPRDVGSNASCVAMSPANAFTNDTGYWISDDCNAQKIPMCNLIRRQDDSQR